MFVFKYQNVKVKSIINICQIITQVHTYIYTYMYNYTNGIFLFYI